MRRFLIFLGLSLALLLSPASIHGLRLEVSARDIALNGLKLSPREASATLRCSYQSLFSLSGLNLYTLHFELPENSRRYYIGFDQLDAESYRQQDYHLGISQILGPATLSFWQNLSYESIEPDEIHETWHSDLALELNYRSFGLLLQSHSIFSAGRTFALQASKTMADRLILGAGLVRDEYSDISWSIGSSYRVSDSFRILSSWQNEPPRLGIGAEFLMGKIGLTYGVRTHSSLDPTHAIDLSYRW